MKIRNVVVILETPLDAIRLAPLVLAMRHQEDIRPIVAVTRDRSPAVEEILIIFDLAVDFTVTIDPLCEFPPVADKTLVSDFDYLLFEEPDLIVVQGHTETAFAAILAAFFHRIPVAHVNDGVPSLAQSHGSMNPLLAMRLSALQLATTARAAHDLLGQGVLPDSVFYVGDPANDSLLAVLAVRSIRKLGRLEDIVICAEHAEVEAVQTSLGKPIVVLNRAPDHHAMILSPGAYGDGGAAQLSVAAIRYLFGVGQRPAGLLYNTVPSGSDKDAVVNEALRPNYV